MRSGVLNASRLSSNGVPDAERAFFVADLCEVYQQYQRWCKNLPEIQPHYAVKSNPDPYVLRLLAALGAGFDCASNQEINQVLALGGGVEPSNIIFANPCKAISFVRAAARAGVDKMTFDNVDELYKIARAHPRAKLVIRILADDSKSICAFNVKFGAALSAVPGLLAKAKELNLDVIGVSFHVGSGCYDPSVYTDAISRCRKVFDMAQDAGYEFDFLDVGGGFEDSLFEQAAAYLRDAIDEYFPERKHIKIIAEPGRYFVSNAFRLATNIIARRAPQADANAHAKVMYYINDGVYGAFNCLMFDHAVARPYVLCMDSSFHVPVGETLSRCSIWGPTCDSIDKICEDAELPARLQAGDWLGFDGMGAYTICAASQFNGFQVSKVVYTAGGDGEMEVRVALAKFAARGGGLQA
ncbi:ornithine decarboxylase [Cylindrobasidium torrendii FP15055 ss-10]|uniref:ornithine decarboxylase n=1 Tax=Cylindrobasidium torrendii FP15055 ss-10 TaxID=1314674 RepID=A0A0D7BI20_9AGAR|nr:ornithine decarboxylase [Cylindrobasidium torrendii FP15055 ss-10]